MPTFQMYLRDDLINKWMLQGRDLDELRIFLRKCLEEAIAKG